MSENAKWYVIHTYSGYEKKVETNIRKLIENGGYADRIIDLRVPEEQAEEVAEGGRKAAAKKLFPSYVFIKMIMSDESWHAVRNIRGVTGFVGPDSKPVALTEDELAAMSLEVKTVKIDFALGDVIRIISGPLANYSGRVLEIDAAKGKVKLAVDLFMGRETEVDIDINQTEPIE